MLPIDNAKKEDDPTNKDHSEEEGELNKRFNPKLKMFPKNEDSHKNKDHPKKDEPKNEDASKNEEEPHLQLFDATETTSEHYCKL